MEIIKGRQNVAWMGALYGVPGIGKSTIAAQAPLPLFLDLEGGLSRIECDKSPRITTWDELVAGLRFAYESHYQTVVLDTIDGLEELIRKHVCDINGWKSIEAPGFGKGWAVMQERFQELLGICEKLKAKGKNILFIGHEQIKTFTSPDQDAYDRYILKMNAKLASILVGRVDFVFFAQYETLLKTDRTNDERLRAVGTGKRILRTQEAPAWIAKNRFNLEPTVPMDKSIFDKLV
jgi:hypothetical protein